MIDKETRKEIISLINREVVPAIGCTEPVAVALCVAKAKELLGELPQHIELYLSGNILKNAMGVGIPGTGMIGLPIAIALGALVGKSEYGLEVLRDVCPEAVEKGKEYIREGRISIKLSEDAPSNLHIDVRVTGEGDSSSRAVISKSHTGFVLLQQGDTVLLDTLSDSSPVAESESEDVALTLKMVYEFATESPLEELEFILEAKRLNKAAAELALAGNYGHSLGATIRSKGTALFGDSPLDHMMSYTSAACDARMGGAQIAVMSNSGSGNQGICATMPVVSYAEDINADEEHLIRALVLSHLTSIYIKQSLGRLSALCGCVVASTGASSGITYLMGGDYQKVTAAVKNMIANLTGMICDGAKPSCSMKISSGVSTALMSAMLAMENRCVTQAEGIISDDVDCSIRNLTSIGREAMRETDKLVLSIMTNK
ncbi:MAG: L-serine ammonia-lyase, iron-sulfur-dependent, subunit alpha [Muribaculaceae bacterium]|nr:L-serine ammonia-lyase, iron-sulfur-dependent, subunit alpha [Muribaculaceae bacterium]MDE6796165.1 L-serine ammonia-lyase, iron-sulfur-dependent, subunit alpha [Muribaculaceae bacterium]